MEKISNLGYIIFDEYADNEELVIPGFEYNVYDVEMLESERKFYENLRSFDIIKTLENFNKSSNVQSLDEETYQDRANNFIFRLEVMDVDKFVKNNKLKPITNPTFFGTNGQPTSDGLLSNDIFGITQKDRAGIYAYIDLVEYFIDPSCYKTLIRLDRRFSNIVKGMGSYSINDKGELIDDPDNGSTGIRWLRENFGKIKFKTTESNTRDVRIQYIKHNYEAGRLFINKYIVIPPYYRDVNTSGKYTGVGQINTFYVNLIVAANALRENNDYGLSMADMTCARIQETLKAIYDWFCGNNNPMITDKGTGLSRKGGLIRTAVMSYTSDYSSRLVLAAPELKVETVNDLMVNLDRSAAPLAAVVADFYPFMMYHMRKFFEQELLNVTYYEAIDPTTGELVDVELEDPMLAFNDTELDKQLRNFVHSYDTRIIPVKLPVKNTDLNYVMVFKGEKWLEPKDAIEGVEPVFTRPLTWVDVIYIAAKKSTEGKKISFTRFPYDSYFNTIYTGIEVASTKETEPLYVNKEFYQFYPKIRNEDILAPSGQKFVDVMQISNLYLKGMGADYDGDTGIMKGSFFKESNEELAGFVDSKANYINLSCENIRVSNNESVQATYNFTKVLASDEKKLTDPEF